MAIRKDIDDMLNSLKSGGRPSATAEKKAPAPVSQRTRKIDNMSVDDLLSALGSSKPSAQPEAVKPKQNISVKKEEDVPVIVSSVMHTESSTHNTKIFNTAEMSEMQAKVSAEVSKPAVKAEQPAPKKRKIVISHELPDYEAIRRQELEKDKRAAEEKARREAEEKARREAEEKARREAEEKAHREAEEKARREAEEKARREAEEKARREAEEQARREAEEQARREAEEQARREAEEKARREAEEKARREAEEQARREAEEQARREAEEQARREAEEQARREAEEQARREAEEKARREAEEKARREAEEQARREAEEKAQKKVIRETEALAHIEDNAPQAETAEVPVLTYYEDEEDEEPQVKTEKKGFFSKIKSMFSGDDIMADDFEETPEETEIRQKAALAEASAKLAESVDALDEKPAEEERSATELIDEAIAALESEAESDFSVEEITDEPEKEESVDSVSKMLTNIRTSAEAAIADIDKKSASDETARYEEPEFDEETEQTEETAKPRKSRFGTALRNILDEDPDEIVNERSEKAEDGDEAPKKKNGKKTLYTVLGVIFSIFAVIGVVAVIVKGAGLMKSFTSGEVKKDGFTEMIYPAVIMDIESFSSPAELTSEQVITATLWSIIMDSEKVSKYESSFGDTVSIPDIDVEKYAVELFGENLPAFTHATVGSVESRFYYSDGAYNVKLRPIIFTYSPEIKSIVKSGSDYKLTVDYIDELPTWMEKTVAKTVEFGLTQNEDGTFCIKSMKILSVVASN